MAQLVTFHDDADALGVDLRLDVVGNFLAEDGPAINSTDAAVK